MDKSKELKIFIAIAAVFLLFYFLPIGTERFDNAIFQALELSKWYAREHVLLCLIPAFLIAGAIGVFLSQSAVIKYLGSKANKVLAYSVASVSGSVLAVCSCTILPLFSGIYRMGAGLGPAVAFLYAGPAINVLAVILTAKVLGVELGIARAVGAIVFSIVIGLIMHFLYRKEEKEKSEIQMAVPQEDNQRPLFHNAIYFALMIGILVFANWGSPDVEEGIWWTIFSNKWNITAVLSLGLAFALGMWFSVKWIYILGVVLVTAAIYVATPLSSAAIFMIGISGLIVLTFITTEEMQNWFNSSWDFTKQIMPLLFYGVLIAGFALGMPGEEGIIPSEWVNYAVGGNSLASTFFASLAGAFMYFATLTEVPIIQGLMGAGMGKGPALALLLAGPALSLPNMLVIRSVLGTQKTIVFVALVVIMATISGYIFGNLM